MKIDEKIVYFEGELNGIIEIFSKKRLRDKKKAFTLKILSVVFAASITILLGIRIDERMNAFLQNVALTLGAVISVLNAVEAFYDHRSLWVNSTVTYSRLLELKRDLKLFSTGSEPADLDIKTFNRLTNRLDEILGDDLNSWLKLRAVDTGSSKEPARSG